MELGPVELSPTFDAFALRDRVGELTAGARDRGGLDGPRHACGGDARRQHPAADRGDAGRGRHGDRETREFRQRRETANSRAHPAVAIRTVSEEIRPACRSLSGREEADIKFLLSYCEPFFGLAEQSYSAN